MVYRHSLPVVLDQSLHGRLTEQEMAYCIQYTLEQHGIAHIAQGRLTAIPRSWRIEYAWDNRHPDVQGYLLLALITSEHTPHYECPFWFPYASAHSLAFYRSQPHLSPGLIFHLLEGELAHSRMKHKPANTT